MQKAIKIILVIVAILLGLLAISAVSNSIITSAEKGEYPPPGTLVTVHGDNMHVYSKGTGEKKVVLLSGLGTPSPVLDFKSLVDKLSVEYTVIVVEYFGYGWSDRTDAPRTVSNIVEEIRASLRLAGFTPPYILMPHSISGIYSLYYASSFPDEVEAIIGLGTSTPAQYPVLEDFEKRGISMYPPSVQGSGFWEFVRLSGLGRIALKLASEQLGVARRDAYSNADMDLLKTMIVRNYGNLTVIAESNNLLANFAAVRDMKIPSTIPTAFILADSTVKSTRAMQGLDWKKLHEDQVADNVYGKVTILSGEHYIHHNHVDDIEIVTENLLLADKK